jgi:hypothetical protein
MRDLSNLSRTKIVYLKIIIRLCICSILLTSRWLRLRSWMLPILLFQINALSRSSRWEAGIRCHGWRVHIHPWSLDTVINPFGTDLHQSECLWAGQTVVY